MVIEEFSPQLFYIKGTHNVVTDALSRLGIDNGIPYEHLTTLADLLRKDPEDLPDDVYPLEYHFIHEFQQRDNKTFHGVGQEWSLICHNEKIVVPVRL